jgi:N-acetylmuramoyl-L-alanine amidase
VAAGAVAFALWAAPATASPSAADFERPLGDAERVQAKGDPGDEGPVTHRSASVPAQRTFEAVGLAGELRPLEIRARPEGGRWTDWIEVANGDPLYVVGGADEAQLRTRGWRPRGRLHFVDVSPGARGAGKGEAPKPKLISRSGWGADGPGGCEPRTGPVYGQVRAIAVHHTVTSNSYPRSESRAIVLAICRYHRNGNGWNDIGYGALADRFGRLFEGRAGGRWKPVVGAHAVGYNAQSAGIAVIGDHSATSPSDAVMKGLAGYLAYRLDRLGFRAGGKATLRSGGGSGNRYAAGTRVRVGRIFRHRDVGITSCPGDALAREIDRLRRITARRMDPGSI